MKKIEQVGRHLFSPVGLSLGLALVQRVGFLVFSPSPLEGEAWGEGFPFPLQQG